MVAIAVELEAESPSGDTTDSDNSNTSDSSGSSSSSSSSSGNHLRYSSCPFCGTLYKQQHPKRCEHLICETEFVESNDELVSIPDHPIVASLFGMEVPRVIAGRFMHFLRTRSSAPSPPPPPSPPSSHTTTTSTPHDPFIPTLDLLNTTITTTNPSQHAIATIKYSCEYPDCFREWTYYLTANPAAAMREFVAFVRKNFCVGGSSSGNHHHGSAAPPVSIPFSRVEVCPEVMTLSVDDLVPERCRIGNWVMLTGLPDNLPLFFFATTTNQGTTVFLNHNTNLIGRMAQWTAPAPTTVTLYSLSRLPAVALN